MNRLEAIRVIMKRHQLSDGGYADIRLPGTDLERLLAVAEAVRRECLAMCGGLCFRDEITRVEECMDCVLAGAADALAPLLEEDR